MVETKVIGLKIKDEAKKLIQKNINSNSIVLLALNDGSNSYSKLGGSCTIGANFQLVVLDKEDNNYPIKVENNLGLKMFTSKDETQFFEDGLVLNAKNSVLSLSSDEGIIDGAVTIDKYESKKLTKEEMESLGKNIC